MSCHINMLKCYLDWKSVPLSPVREDGKAVMALSMVLNLLIKPRWRWRCQVLISLRQSLLQQCLTLSWSRALFHERLNNFELLSKLDECFPHLTRSQREDVAKLNPLHVSLFSDVPTQTRVLQHDIVVGDSPPIKQHAYRMNPDKRLRLQKQVNYMLENGIAGPSSSSWSSPCLWAVKSDGSDRFCTDFCKVNGVTKPDCSPLPRVEDCVDHVGSAQFVTKLEPIKRILAGPANSSGIRICICVLYLHYTVLPFGACNAPAAFQRLVNTVLSGLSGCEALLDDIVVYSSSWSDHTQQMMPTFLLISRNVNWPGYGDIPGQSYRSWASQAGANQVRR